VKSINYYYYYYHHHHHHHSWRKFHNDELHSLYSSPNIDRVIKSRRMRWAGHVHAWGRGVPKVRDHWENLGVAGRITLRWTLRK
jgi:hypothetical protein